MKTTCGLAVLVSLIMLLSACGRKIEAASGESKSESKNIDKPSEAADPAGSNAAPSPVLYRPSPVSADSSSFPPGKAEAAYEEAAKIFSRLKGAANYEREKIATDGMQFLSQALELSAARLKSESNAPNLLRLVQIDPRFAYAQFLAKYRELLASSAQAAGISPYAELKITVRDVDSPRPVATSDSQAAPGPGVKAPDPTRFGPDKALDDVRRFGDAVAATALGLQEQERLNRKLQQLIDAALKTDNWRPILALAATDEPRVKAAKVALADAFSGLLGSITFYKGSYFLARETSIGRIDITQFRQPVGVFPSLGKVSEPRQANTGIEWEGACVFGPKGYSRTYAGGWWGPWSNDPGNLAEVGIQKAGVWIVTHRERCRYFRLTAQEIEVALSRDETTRAIVKFAETHDDNDNPKTIMNHADALALRGEAYEARELAKGLLHREDLDLDIAKWLTSFFANNCSNMPAALAVEPAPEKTPARQAAIQNAIIPGQIRKSEPRRGWRPENPDLRNVVQAYQILIRADPEDPDACLDLALLSRSITTGNTLYDAAKAATKRSPASGRDFRYIIAETPTFAKCFNEPDFRLVLSLLGKKREEYLNQFLPEISK